MIDPHRKALARYAADWLGTENLTRAHAALVAGDCAEDWLNGDQAVALIAEVLAAREAAAAPAKVRLCQKGCDTGPDGHCLVCGVA